jgi:hypothetical protein
VVVSPANSTYSISHFSKVEREFEKIYDKDYTSLYIPCQIWSINIPETLLRVVRENGTIALPRRDFMAGKTL